ncbi:MAG: ABC transporter permease [Candidatus Dormibacteraeota bacterium]|uniref:Transport permease protein n=1 Tax=Candidatus Amunia macphersoniae TaxID=3127014 RepID=A0A934KI31_9BACT|nr:ABC transporter permease [Candidatus Dormibacteraeota bacterium]
MTVDAPRAVGAVEAPAAVTRPSGVRVPLAQAVYIIWYRDIVRFRRDRVRLVMSLAQPVLYLVIFGVGLSSSIGRGGSLGAGLPASFSYLQFMYPGVLGMAVLFTAIFSAMSVVWDREFGFLREILVAPISRSAVALGKTLGGATQAALQGVVMLVFAPIIGVHLTVVSVLETIPLLFLLAFALTSLGVALSARLKTMQGFQVVMNFLMMPMFFLSGALFPLRNLPGWMTVLTRFDPVAYGIAPVRSAILAGSGLPQAAVDRVASVTIGNWVVPVAADIGVLVLFSAVMLAIAMRSFRHRD